MRYFTKAKTMPDQQAQGCPVANNIRSGMASKWTATGRATWSDTQVRMDLAGRDSCVICGLTYWFEAKQPGVHGLLKDRLRNYEIYEIWTKENIKKTGESEADFWGQGLATHGFPQSTDCYATRTCQARRSIHPALLGYDPSTGTLPKPIKMRGNGRLILTHGKLGSLNFRGKLLMNKSLIIPDSVSTFCSILFPIVCSR